MDTINRLNGHLNGHANNGHAPPPSPPTPPQAAYRLSPLAAALLPRLDATPRNAKALARLAGYHMGSHVYAALRELESRGLCVRTAEGYRRLNGEQDFVMPTGMVVLKQMAAFGGPMSALVQILGAVVANPPADPCHFELQANGVRVLLDLRPLSQSLDVPPEDGLSPLAKAILGVLTPAPQTAKTLARLAGYHINPHFRGGLRELMRRDPPLCVRTPEGYRLP